MHVCQLLNPRLTHAKNVRVRTSSFEVSVRRARFGLDHPTFTYIRFCNCVSAERVGPMGDNGFDADDADNADTRGTCMR
jgi:hypothetical protein